MKRYRVLRRSYSGRHGHSLRLDGLEPDLHDHIRAHALVIHGAACVAPQWMEKYGRLGCSLVFPAVQQGAMGALVDQPKEGQSLFVWRPQISQECYRDCGSISVARSGG